MEHSENINKNHRISFSCFLCGSFILASKLVCVCGVDKRVIIDYEKKTVGIKIVFFGPAMSGKTTTIKWLFKELNLKEELTSIENSIGRTMFMDFGIIPFQMGDGWNLQPGYPLRNPQ